VSSLDFLIVPSKGLYEGITLFLKAPNHRRKGAYTMNQVNYKAFIGVACCLFSIIVIFLGLFTHGWVIIEGEEDGIPIKLNLSIG